MLAHSRKNKGYISTFFLGVFLYITTLMTVIVYNLNARMKAMLNLELLNEQQLAEFEVIESFKQELLEERIRREKKKKEEETEEIEVDEDSTKNIEVEETIESTYESGTASFSISIPNKTDILIQYDPETLEILDYETFRDMQNVQY